VLAPALFRRRFWASLTCMGYCANDEAKVPLYGARGYCTRMSIVPFAQHAAVAALATLTLTVMLAMPICSAGDAAPASPVAGAKDSRGDAGRGEADYATYCSPCHGTRGNGRGPMVVLLNPKPTRHSDTAYMKALSDDYLFRLIRDGGPAVGKSPMMASWKGILSDQQIWNLITYIRSLAE